MLRLHSYRYHRPATLAQALDLLAEHGPAAMLVAGGTDLVPNMKHRLFTPDHLVSVRRLPELLGIREGDGELRIGAGETMARIARHPLVGSRLPSLARAASLVAGPQIRNAATLGGNLCLDTRCTYYNQTEFWRGALGYCLKKDGTTCHVTQVGRKCVAAHSADTPPVLLTLAAAVDLVSPDGRRSVPLDAFFVADGAHNTIRRPDEVVTTIRVPLPSPARAAFEKLRQRGAIDFPLLNVAVAFDFQGDLLAAARVAVSALGSRPRMISGLDKVILGRPLDDEVVQAIARRAFEQCHPLENIPTDPEWRRAMVPILVRRAIARAVA